jgi:hypothetical protein
MYSEKRKADRYGTGAVATFLVAVTVVVKLI